MNRLLPFALALLVLAASRAPAAAEPTAPAQLTLEECVHRALQRNFDVQIGRFDNDSARQSLVIARSVYDPSLTLSSTKSGTRTPAPGGVSSTGWETRVGASEQILTGGKVGLSTALNRDTSTARTTTVPYNPTYDSDITLSVTQPLLKNAGIAVNRAAIDQAAVGVTKQDLVFRGSVMTVVLDTEQAFYQLCFARQQLGVRHLSMDAAQRLFEENKTKRDTGVLTDLDVATAEVGVATAQREVLLAAKALHDSEDALRALIGQFEMDTPVDTGDLASPPITPLDTAATYERAKAAQPEYLAARANLDQLRLAVRIARNARLPEVDLNGAVGYNNLGQQAGRTYGDIVANDGYNWQVGVSITYPWGTRGDTARYRQAVNNLDRESSRLRQTDQNLLVQARSSVRAVETNREALRVAVLATGLAVKQYELQKARFDAGLSTARLVLDAQTDLDTARVNELSSKVALLQSLASLRRLEGRTLAAYDVRLQP